MKRVGWSLLHESLEIRETGRYGKGIFAINDIDIGDILCVMGGQIANTALENTTAPLSCQYNMDFSEEFSYCPLDISQVESMPQFFFNHSCAPNSGFFDSHTLVAMRHIAGGDEVCYDYAFCMWSSTLSDSHFVLKCLCGQESCRGTIQETDWCLDTLQQHYANWFMPFLRAKFKDQH